MVEQTINEVLKICKVKSNIALTDFRVIKDIPTHHYGVYVISEGSKVIYVGQGHVRDRLLSHWEKAYENLDQKKLPKGWRWLTENYETLKLNPLNWIVHYVILEKPSKLTRVEGDLIDELQPLANEETYQDHQQLLKG